DPEVTGRDYVGAVVGSSGTNDSLQYEFTHVENGKVTGRNYIGGLIGKLGNSASLSYSSFTGQIKGAENVGGLVGSIEFKFNMTTSYFIGSVVGENNVGGVSGKADVNNGYIALNKVYVVADLTGGTNVNYLYGVRNLKVGGWYDIQFSDVYFDKEKTKYITQEKQGEVTGLTTEQMKNPANFSEYWHFGRDWEVDPSRNDGYPIVIVTYE
ncbi:GLUG motif-containing protein, partial [Bacillus pacificus]